MNSIKVLLSRVLLFFLSLFLPNPLSRNTANRLKRGFSWKWNFSQAPLTAVGFFATTLLWVLSNQAFAHDWDNWHRLMQRVATRSLYELPHSLLGHYNRACHLAIIDLLQRGKTATCQRADPTGLDALTVAKDVRRLLKAVARRRAITPGIEEQLTALNRRADLLAESLPGTAPVVARAHG